MNELTQRARKLLPEKPAGLPSLAAMAAPPRDPEQREEIGQQVWSALCIRFEMSLSERDCELWKNPPTPSELATSPEHLRLVHSFDDFLLHRVAEWGWRLLMSEGVLQRLAEWEKHSPNLLERFGKQLMLRSKVLRAEAKAPFPEDIEEFADAVIPELKILLYRQKQEFGRRLVTTCDRIAAWMKLEIDEHRSDFALLAGNLEQLHGFVAALPRWNGKIAERLVRGDMQAPEFFYRWYASLSGRSAKDVRNEISRRRTQRRIQR